MVRVLLLDCSSSLKQRLKAEGWDVEAGTSGFCHGERKLPSQVYEKDIFVYNPESCTPQESFSTKTAGGVSKIRDHTPEYSLEHLKQRIENGATFVAFANHLSGSIEHQNGLYNWIPYMPPLEFTSDKYVRPNALSGYLASDFEFLIPIISGARLSFPVKLKLKPPARAEFGNDVCHLFWNGHSHCLGVIICRGYGRLIVLPRYESNDDVVETFMNRVVPRIYKGKTRERLVDIFISPTELAAQGELNALLTQEKELGEKVENARVSLTKANNEKLNTIEADETAKQIHVYYDCAVQQEDAALFYLYKILEVIENKFGGESEGIKAVGERDAWKTVKKQTNESYRDARHAPKPGDVIKPWTAAEIKKCFDDTLKVVAAYYKTLF